MIARRREPNEEEPERAKRVIEMKIPIKSKIKSLRITKHLSLFNHGSPELLANCELFL